MVATKKSLPKLAKFKKSQAFWPKLVFILLAGLVLGFLTYRGRGKILSLFLAGQVNGQPVFKSQLSKRLYSRYGKQALEDLIVEELIQQEAKSKGVVISNQDFEQAQEKIKKQLGEKADLDSLLAFQGVNREEFKRQLELEISMRKILEKEIVVSQEEIDSFVKENKKYLAATTEGELTQEAKEKLLDQKVGERVNTWVNDLLGKAKVLRFL